MVMKGKTETRRLEGCAVLFAALAVVMVFGFPGRVSAQVYPSRPITMVVPFAAGGPTDTIARIMAERMRQSLGQPVIVEDVGGAENHEDGSGLVLPGVGEDDELAFHGGALPAISPGAPPVSQA